MNNSNQDFNFGMDAIRMAKTRLSRITASMNANNVGSGISDNDTSNDNSMATAADRQVPAAAVQDQVSEAIARLSGAVMGQVEAATARVKAMQEAAMERYPQHPTGNVDDVIDIQAVEVSISNDSSL